MADVKISGLPASTVPLAGTEVLPIVQGTTTKQVSIANVTAGRAISATTIQSTVVTGTAPLTVASTTEVANLRAANATSADTSNQIKSNATTGVLQVAGPATASTRVMTTPDANFTSARTDAAQTFTGDQTFSGDILVNAGPAPAETTAGQIAGNGMLILSKQGGVVANGTLDLTVNTDIYFGTPGGFVGILNVSSTRTNFAPQSRRTVYAVAAYGTTLDITTLETQDGSSGGSTFTITMPSNGVIRFTDTSGQDVAVRLSFFGSKSLA